MTSDLERVLVDSIDAVRRARGLSVRAMEGAADLPDRSIRNVIRGHRPSLARADEICRALGIILTLGVRPAARPSLRSATPPPPRMEAVSDRQLAELVARLADWWESADPAERARLAGAIEGNLDLAGARGGRRFAALSAGSAGE